MLFNVRFKVWILISTLRCKKSKRYVTRDALDVSVNGGGGGGGQVGGGGGALRDDPKNGCVADYWIVCSLNCGDISIRRTHISFVNFLTVITINASRY